VRLENPSIDGPFGSLVCEGGDTSKPFRVQIRQKKSPIYLLKNGELVKKLNHRVDRGRIWLYCDDEDTVKSTICVFRFAGKRGAIIHRPITVLYRGKIDVALDNELKPKGEYIKKLPTKDLKIHSDRGEKPPGSWPYINLLDHYYPGKFTGGTEYNVYCREMLWHEELQMTEDIKVFDLENVRLDRDIHGGRFLYRLQVLGLVEKRPSLLAGDRVFATLRAADGQSFLGYIHKVEEYSILVSFNFKNMSSAASIACHKVRFGFSRAVFRRMHRALLPTGVPDHLDQLYFPERPYNVIRPNSEIRPFNLNLNEQQRRAIMNIMSHKGVIQGPYIIYGPPGTGKTSTVVEAIMQVFYVNPKSKIMVTAPSNTAADLLAERLITLARGPPSIDRSVVRLNSMHRSDRDLNSNLKKISMRQDDFTSAEHLRNSLEKFRIVVVTCTSAAVLHGINVQNGYFSHIIVDEAGQATEPESSIPITHFASSNTVVVLAGDPKQLGPIVRSNKAKKMGLGRSLLERIMNRELYKSDISKYSETNGYNPLHITKLVQNYRSHPEILHFPSQVFYGGELEAHADEDVRNKYIGWRGLPRRDVPLLFEHVNGIEQREADSPSWFNNDEIQKIVKLIENLFLSYKTGFIMETDIGVIAPYQKQAEKLRLAFNRQRWPDIKVGSTEQFQGQEYPIIIISTVRSVVQAVDKTHNIGFLSNEKRMNVAITRPKGLLIIVGNSTVLSTNRYWKSMIGLYKAKGCFRGNVNDDDADDETEMIEGGVDDSANDLEFERRT